MLLKSCLAFLAALSPPTMSVMEPRVPPNLPVQHSIVPRLQLHDNGGLFQQRYPPRGAARPEPTCQLSRTEL